MANIFENISAQIDFCKQHRITVFNSETGYPMGDARVIMGATRFFSKEAAARGITYDADVYLDGVRYDGKVTFQREGSIPVVELNH